MDITLYNSLTKRDEIFAPLETGRVKMYTCGPTVYDFQHIGNYRTFFLSDILYRTLTYSGYTVDYIMNLTDVGHLFDNDDARLGTDKLEEAAEKQGRNVTELADFYIDSFLKDFEKLNFSQPRKFTRASEYIPEQINLIRTLERLGYTYETDDGVYYDTSKLETYGRLTGMSEETIKEGARVEPNTQKKNPMDFALWKFSPKDKRRWQEWDSPWGLGFPGWHIECSAMNLKELGEQIDLHVGGEDIKMHHQNEIAQCESATGKTFSKYWVHGSFLQVDGGKMGKSLGNAYTLSDIENKGFDAFGLRYFYMNAHYSGQLNFTWSAMQSSQNALKKLGELISGYKENPDAEVSLPHIQKFESALFNNLNVPQALAALWDTLKSDIKEETKVATALHMDRVLGLNLMSHVGFEVPQKILDMVRTRTEYRKAGIFDKADVVRREIAELGYLVEDLPDGRNRIKRNI